MKKDFIKKLDIVLVIAALAVSAVLYFCINAFNEKGDIVSVKVNDLTVAELPINEDTVFEIETENGITNILEISDGTAKMISADCPDKICVNHKSISKNNETIVCLPNKVLITVVSEKENEIDGVAK